MVNKTESGAVAVGAPMSDARMLNEAKHALKSENAMSALYLTEEGEQLVDEWLDSDFEIVEHFLEEYIKNDT